MLQREYGARLDLPDKQWRTRVCAESLSKAEPASPSEWPLDESERAEVGERKGSGGVRALFADR